MIFSFPTAAGGGALQSLLQQLFSVRVYRVKKSASRQQQQSPEASWAGVARAYREVFSHIDKEQFTKLLSDVKVTPRRLLREKKFTISFGDGRSLLVVPDSARILVQCRGFRTRVSTTGFNKHADEKKPQSIFDYFANVNQKFSPNNEKRVRDDLDHFNSYKTEIGKLSDGQQKPFTDGFVKGLLSKNEKPSDVPKRGTMVRNFVSFVVFLIILNYITGFIKIRINDKNIGSILFSSAQEVKPEDITVTFDDVRGMEEAKQEVEEIVNYLRDPDRFSRLGGRLPKGVLLVGPPGTGKTLLARAIAGEAQVPFFHTSGSEFDEMLVGQGARRVRDLFERAKEKAPCIVFIDEIDSVGSKRVSNGLHPYANQTINQLLSEMDGFDRNEGVIVIGATNRVEDLDKALLRPGRFDVRVTVSKPDLADRIDIFKLYLGKIVHDKSINIESLAKGTPGFTGADIENMVNQAALKAATENCKRVSMSHLEEAKDRVLMGPARLRGRFPDEETNKITAYHEAGHTLVALYTKGSIPLHKVTIISRGSSLGHTALLPEKDSLQVTRAQLLAQMDVMMGGRVAEELIFGDDHVTTGAANDLKSATELALDMVKEYGMSEKVGLRDFTVTDDRNSLVTLNELSVQTNDLIDQEVNRLLNESYMRAKDILLKHKKEHKLLADMLLEYETLSADEVRQVLKGEKIQRRFNQPPPPPPPRAAKKQQWVAVDSPSSEVRTLVAIDVD